MWCYHFYVFIAVLEDVKNITKQCDENEIASKRVDSLLSNYEAKLKELEDLLKQAGNMVKKASNQNDINTESLQDIMVSIKNFTILKTRSIKRECTSLFFSLKKRVRDLERERDLVADQIALAVDQLKETEGLLNMFNDSKTVNFQKNVVSLRGFGA